MAVSPAPLSEHKCPGCIYMELEYEEAKKGLFQRSGKSKLDLYLSIQFNEEKIEAPFGVIKFGIQSGELVLKLIHCTMPLSSQELGGEFLTIVEVTKKDQQNLEIQNSLKASVKNNQPGAEASRAVKTTTGKEASLTLEESQVTGKGTAENPSWMFRNKAGKPFLEGRLRAKLGTLDLMDDFWSIVATFEVSERDIAVTGGEGVWFCNLSQGQRVTLDRALAKLLLKRKFFPFMSKVEITHDV